MKLKRLTFKASVQWFMVVIPYIIGGVINCGKSGWRIAITSFIAAMISLYIYRVEFKSDKT